MRRIETREKIEKRKKRSIAIMSVIMLGVLVLGTAGYGFLYGGGIDSGNENSGSENPLGRFSINFNGRELYFSNYPEDVADITVEGDYNINSFIGKALYIDSENSGITNELASTLGAFVLRVQGACYGKCEKDLPEKNCQGDNLIVWREGAGKVYQNGSCVFIEGDLRAADAFLFELFQEYIKPTNPFG